MRAKNNTYTHCMCHPWHPILKLTLNSVRPGSCGFSCWDQKQTQLSLPELFLQRGTLNQLLRVRKHRTCNLRDSGLLVEEPPYLHLNSVVNKLRQCWDGSVGTGTAMKHPPSPIWLIFQLFFQMEFYLDRNCPKFGYIVDIFKERLQILQMFLMCHCKQRNSD